jgi:hypothetical protein
MPQQPFRPQPLLTPATLPPAAQPQGVLGAAGMQLQAPQRMVRQPQQELANYGRARARGLAAALSNDAMRPTQSGSWVEGLARALQVGMQARAGIDTATQEEQDRANDLNRERRQEYGAAQAAQATSLQDMARILAENGDPNAAMQINAGVLGADDEDRRARDRSVFEADLGFKNEARMTPLMVQREGAMTPIWAERQTQLGGIENQQQVDLARALLPVEAEGLRQEIGIRQRYATPTGGGAQSGAPASMPPELRGLWNQWERSGSVLEAINRAMAQSSDVSTGITNATTGWIGGTPAFDLNATVDEITSNIGFDELRAMRAASPTGAALGSVTERELALLQSVIGSLRASQSREQFEYNLQRVRDQYNRSRAAIQQAMQQDFGVPAYQLDWRRDFSFANAPPRQGAGAGTGAAANRPPLRFNPASGGLTE